MSRNIKSQPKNDETFTDTLYLVDRMGEEHSAALIEALTSSREIKNEETIIYSSQYCPKALILKTSMLLINKPNLTDEEAEILTYIARNPATPVEVLTMLAKHKSPIIKTLTAGNPSTPSKLLDVLGKDKTWEVRQQVAFNPATSKKTINLLIKDVDTNVSNTALTHPKTDARMLLEGLGENPDLPKIRAACRNKNLPAENMLKWSQHHSVSVQAAIASNPSTPKNILYALSQTDNSTIQAAIAGNISIPADLALILSNPVHELNVRANLSENPNINEHVATLLLVDPSPMVRRKTALLHKNIPSSALAQAALEEEDPRVIAAITTHPKMPTNIATHVVAKTLNSKDLSYSKSLMRAIAYSDTEVHPGIAYLIAGVNDQKTLAVLATRSDCPLAIFTASAKHENPALRRAAAANPECPADLLYRLAQDEDPLTATLAKTHPSYINL